MSICTKSERTRSIAHLDAVVARSSDDLARVELERINSVIVLQRLEYATSTQIPDLSGVPPINRSAVGDSSGTYADGLIQTAADNM